MELFTPDFGLIFWMFVSFAILFFVLWKWGWPAIMKGVSDRADLIDKGVEYAQNAKQQLDHAREEADKYIADARRQQADMLREADKMMDAAKVSIEQERKQAEQQFRNEVSSFALDIAQKVVRNQMKDEKAQEQLVSSLLDEMEKQN